jgi:probable rRNA maturation factor
VSASVDVVIEAEGWRNLPEVEALVTRAAAAALARPTGAPGPVTVTVLLGDDAAVRDLNRRFRGKDRPTNVLSFPAGGGPAPGAPRHLGDIALAFETVAREAEAERKTLADHAAHLIVHGVLHLLGHDHETEADAEAMESAEVAILARLGIADPYGDLAA